MNEEERNELEKRLYQVSKMETMGVLTSGIAHDFNNILTAVLGCTDIALEEADKSSEIYEELEHIQSISQHGVDLIRRLLFFCRRSTMEIGLQNINIIFTEIMEIVARLIGENIVVSTDLCKDLWMIRAQRVCVEQMLINLIINASDAMPDGGILMLKTENHRLPKNNNRSCMKDQCGNYIHLSISDTGIGMKPDMLNHIFEPFFSTKKPEGGTGLGLSIVNNIIQKYNGWMHVESEPGKGTTFDIYLPAMYEYYEKE